MRLGLGVALGRNAAYAHAPDIPGVLGPSLLAMWDAERVDTLTLSGANVVTWRDRVLGLAPTQPLGASRPIWSANSFNGRPGVIFDGADDYLEGGAVGLPVAANASELWMLVDQAAPASDLTTARPALEYGGATAPTRRGLRRALDLSTSQSRAAATVNSSVNRNTAVLFEGRKVVRVKFGASSTTVSIDGVEQSFTVTPTTEATILRIGAIAAGSATAFWMGAINLALMTLPLSNEQALWVGNLLKQRGGL